MQKDVMRCFEARAAMPILVFLRISVLDDCSINFEDSSLIRAQRPIRAAQRFLDVQTELSRTVTSLDAIENDY